MVMLAFLDENWPVNMHHTIQARNFKFDVFDLVTSGDLDLSCGYQRLGGGGYLEVKPRVEYVCTCARVYPFYVSRKRLVNNFIHV